MASCSMHRKICMGCRTRFVVVATYIFIVGRAVNEAANGESGVQKPFQERFSNFLLSEMVDGRILQCLMFSNEAATAGLHWLGHFVVALCLFFWPNCNKNFNLASGGASGLCYQSASESLIGKFPQKWDMKERSCQSGELIISYIHEIETHPCKIRYW